MEPFIVFKYLHVVTMFFAVALAMSGEIVLRRVAGTMDPAVIRVTVARVKPVASNGSTALFLLGLLFGLVAAVTGQLDLLRPWLVLSYVAFAAAMAIGITITDPWVGRLERAAAADGTGSKLAAVVADRRALIGTWMLQGIVAIIVFLMVVKPLG